MLSGLNERIASVQTDIRDASAKLERDEAARVERIRDKLTGLIRTTFEFGDDGRAEAMRPDAAATTTEAPPAQGANLLSETGILAGREALGGVRAQRPCIRPNDGFIERLRNAAWMERVACRTEGPTYTLVAVADTLADRMPAAADFF